MLSPDLPLFVLIDLQTVLTPGMLGFPLGFQVFHEPLRLDDYWILLLLPMVAAISVVYKAIKLEDLSRLPSQATSLALQIVMFMVLAAAMLWLITELV